METSETSFYHDSNMRNTEAVNKMKSNMSLDFGAAPTKRRATQTSNLLNSPDLNLLKLASPELERLIIQQSNGMVTTTPTPTQFINPKFVTEEQEEYARGFVNALTKLHENEGEIPMVTEVSGAPVTTLTTMIPSSTTMGITDISNSNPMITSAGLPVSTVMSTSCYQSQPQQMGMTYTTANMLPPASQILPAPVSTAADLMPVTSQQQYTTLLPPTSQAQQQIQAPQQMYNTLPVQPQEPERVLQLKQEEPQIVPNLGLSPPISPINLEVQEKIKLERKRERNRVAARKCRTRKLERISRLEDRVSELKGQNTELVTTATKLRDQVAKLKSQIMEHVKSGCQVMMSQNLL